MGGNEITAMAGTHPQRVDRIVCLDGAYDFADPVFVAAFKMAPPTQPPTGARASLDSWLAYQRNEFFPGVTEIVNVPGAHVDFALTNREQVVAVMRRFLSGSPAGGERGIAQLTLGRTRRNP